MLLATAGVSATAIALMVAVDRAFFSEGMRVCGPQSTQTSRAAAQVILDGVVRGPSGLAPGATAYVSGPHGSWLGAAGVADMRRHTDQRFAAGRRPRPRVPP